MHLSELEKSLIKSMEEIEVIDCHEHLEPERARTESVVDIFSLFTQYTLGDLLRAGMTYVESSDICNGNIPLERRWSIFEPYWKQIRFGSYSRAVLLAVNKFYGFDDINAKTCEPISNAMKEANKPGIYERVLREACNIRASITQCHTTELGSSLLVPIMPMY